MDDAGGAVDSIDSFLIDAVCGLSSRADHGADPEPPGIGAVIAERYLLERLLGRGGMGTVYAGRHVVTGRRVAIKLLRGDPVRNPDAALRMAREARAVGRIHHPNVVAVYDAGFAAERPFIAMELLHGESLEQRIERTGSMDEAEAVRTLQRITRGVEAAHASGIIHRDLKPANILLCPAPDGANDIVKVLDFGISKLRGDGEEDLMVTGHGVQIGTPVFMSPEQVRGDALDERADVYALAVMLHYMLTQRFPFHARSRAELFAKILTAEPVPLAVHRPGVSPAIATVVRKGLARDRACRYESVTALAAALARPNSGPSKFRWAASSSRVAYCAAAVSGLVLTRLPTHSMQAVPLRHEVAVVQLQSEEQPSSSVEPQIVAATESSDVSVIENQASAVVAPKAVQSARARQLAPARTKVRASQPSIDTAVVVRDDKVANEVKLMSW